MAQNGGLITTTFTPVLAGTSRLSAPKSLWVESATLCQKDAQLANGLYDIRCQDDQERHFHVDVPPEFLRDIAHVPEKVEEAMRDAYVYLKAQEDALIALSTNDDKLRLVTGRRCNDCIDVGTIGLQRESPVTRKLARVTRAGNQQLGIQDEPAIEVDALPGPGEHPLPPAVKHAVPKEDNVRT